MPPAQTSVRLSSLLRLPRSEFRPPQTPPPSPWLSTPRARPSILLSSVPTAGWPTQGSEDAGRERGGQGTRGNAARDFAPGEGPAWGQAQDTQGRGGTFARPWGADGGTGVPGGDYGNCGVRAGGLGGTVAPSAGSRRRCRRGRPKLGREGRDDRARGSHFVTWKAQGGRWEPSCETCSRRGGGGGGGPRGGRRTGPGEAVQPRPHGARRAGMVAGEEERMS